MPDARTPAAPPAWFPFDLRRLSTALKLAAIGFLMLVLLIPLAMVDSVLRERLERRDAQREFRANFVDNSGAAPTISPVSGLGGGAHRVR